MAQVVRKRKRTARQMREEAALLPLPAPPRIEVPRTEVHTFSKETLEAMAKKWAKMLIVGDVLHGSIGQQEVRWNGDSLEVLTWVVEER